MYVLKNFGNSINRATYEYVCDTVADLDNIPKEKVNLGSTAVVLLSTGAEFYMANSSKEWIKL